MNVFDQEFERACREAAPGIENMRILAWAARKTIERLAQETFFPINFEQTNDVGDYSAFLGSKKKFEFAAGGLKITIETDR